MSLDTLAPASTTKLVEIHVDEQVIDHPVVRMRWCLSPETTRYMRANPEFDWALIIFAQKRSYRDEASGVVRMGNSRHETRLVVEGFRAISQGFDFLTFRSPDHHDLVGYLIHSGPTKTDREQFWKQIRKYAKKDSSGYGWEFDMLNAEGEPEEFNAVGVATMYALDHIQADIPNGIFAKPMSPWAKKLVNKYGLGVGEDECAGRWRLWLAIAFSILEPFVNTIVFVFTRVWLTLLGVGHLILGGDPTIPWRTMFNWEVAPSDANLWMNRQFETLPVFTGLGALLTPVVLAIVGGLGYLGFVTTSYGWWILGGIIVIIVAIVVIGLTGDFIDKQTKKNEMTARQRYVRVEMDLVERYTICSGEATKGPRKFSLTWSGVKRVVCKPRAL